MKMSPSGALTEQRVDLPGSPDPAGYMRPVTRSQTRSRPSLKRKGASEDKMKAGRPAKLARTASSSSDAPPKPKREPIIGIPTDVPRSMLSTFRVGPSPFQMYDGESGTTVDAVSRSSSPPRFPATAAQAMFDHCWQVAPPDPLHCAGDEQPLGVSVCAPLQHPTLVHHHLPTAAIPPAPAQDVGPVLRTIRRVREHGDENRSPAGLAMEVPAEDHVSPLKATCSGDDRSIAPLSPSTVSSPNRLSIVIEPIASFPLTSDHAAMLVTALPPPLRPGTSSLGVEDGEEKDATIVEPGPSYYFPGQMPYASHQLVPLHPGYMHFGAPPPVYPPFMPHLSHVSHLSSRPTDRPSSASDHQAPHPPHLTVHPSYSLQGQTSFAAAQSLHSHAPSAHTQGVPSSTPSPSIHGFPGIMPSLPPLDTATPWCTMFDSLKGGNKRLGGASKQKKKRTAASLPAPEACPSSSTSPQPRADTAAPRAPPVEVHPCPLCPRTFTLPNSLAIHLKWHWGASGLDWKKGDKTVSARLSRF